MPSHKPEFILKLAVDQCFGLSLGQLRQPCAHGAVYQFAVQRNDNFKLVVVLAGHAEGDSPMDVSRGHTLDLMIEALGLYREATGNRPIAGMGLCRSSRTTCSRLSRSRAFIELAGKIDLPYRLQ